MTDVRYRLVLNSYPAEDLIPRVCKALYNTTEKNLLASLSSLPYIVGRSFSEKEAHQLAVHLRDLGVGFTFKSQSDEATDIHFDPKNPQSSSLDTNAAALNPNSPVPGKWITSSIIVILLAALAFLLHEKEDLTNDPKNIEAVLKENSFAKITQVTHSVETKPSASLVWKKAETDQSLAENDSLRTYENSTAGIRYANGSTILIKPNTLMVLGRSHHESDRRIDLEDGAIQARLQASQKPYNLKIHTKAGVLEVQSPEKPGEESQLETQMKGGQLKVTLTKGSAKLIPSNPRNPEVKIQSDQELTADAQSVSRPKPIASPLELLHPQLDTKIQLDPLAEQPIQFEWENLGENARYIWELASDEGMQNILLKQETQEPKLKVNYLDLGTVYWRVIAERPDSKFVSHPRRLYVEKQHD